MTATQPDSQAASSAPVSPASPEEKASAAKAKAKAPVKKAVAKKPTATARKTATDAALATPAKPAAKPITPKPLKPKKPKLVRDSFTIPKLEYVVLEELKARAIKLAYPVKKTELIRAGIKALAAMADASFLTALKAVPVIKTGRPTKD